MFVTIYTVSNVENVDQCNPSLVPMIVLMTFATNRIVDYTISWKTRMMRTEHFPVCLHDQDHYRMWMTTDKTNEDIEKFGPRSFSVDE